MRLFQILLLLFVISAALVAQEHHRMAQPSSVVPGWVEKEIQQYAAAYTRTLQKSTSDTRYDVTFYKLNLRPLSDQRLLRGAVTMIAKAVQPGLGSIFLDLSHIMTVDSVSCGPVPAVFRHTDDTLNITLDRSYGAGEYFTTTVYYHGTPQSTGFGSFMFRTHAQVPGDNVPWIWTLSEPYGASDWWPCKNHPSDKADSADILVTCDTALRVGSNGKLASIRDNRDGTHTYIWQERYPIASYLISFALTNYAAFSNWFVYTPADSMEILNYVLPEHLEQAKASLPLTVDMLRIFSDLYGLYPFIKEKYGHSEFGWGGAMEHQTMTSTTTFDEIVVAHELAHQWFGDKITCGSWHDIWLNEGFASYSEALYVEKKYGTQRYNDAVANFFANARGAPVPVYAPDTTDYVELFNHASTYAKGGVVLHMLRHILGDSVFFRCIHAYANDPRYAYKSAVTQDLINVVETVSGKDLQYFFDEWVFGDGYPKYRLAQSVDFVDGSYRVRLTISQQNLTGTTPAFFTMPLDVKFSFTGGDTIVTVLNDSISQTFTFNFRQRPSMTTLDPGNWVLKSFISPFTNGLPMQYYLSQNFPDPFPQPSNNSTTIPFGLGHYGRVTIKVYSILGQEVATLLDDPRGPGDYEVQWNASGIASGMYFCRMQAGNFMQMRKILVVK